MRTGLVVGSFTPSVLLRVARLTGQLAERSVDVEEVGVTSSPAQFRSLFDGQLDAVLTSPDNVLAYRYVPDNPLARTGDVRIASAVDRGLGLALYGRPGLAVHGLAAGASIGVDVPSSGFAFALYAILESMGLDREAYQIVPLGSTPQRLLALLRGECDATMLNAGSELLAEQAGCEVFARVAAAASPYLGTVLALVEPALLQPVSRLAVALQVTARRICSGELDNVVTSEATAALGLPSSLASRYLRRLKDPSEGLIIDGVVDPAALATVVDLRRRFRPAVVEGLDLLAAALIPASGLVATGVAAP